MTNGEASASAAPSIADPTSAKGTWRAPLLRFAAGWSIASSVLGTLIVPGVRGNASQSVVELWERISMFFANVTALTLLALCVLAAIEIGRSNKVDAASRVTSIACAGVVALVVLLLVVPFGRFASSDRLTPELSVAAAVAASLASMTSAWTAARAPHTRAVAVVLGTFGMASLFRVGGWEVAAIAGERASASLYAFARGLSTVAVIAEALGQLAAAAWIGTRRTLSSRIGSNAAIVGAFLLTWAAASGVHAGAPLWQAALHTALADAAGSPPAFALGAVATFLSTAALLFALAALILRKQLAPVVAALALALLARGAFDAPLRALAASTASLWAILVAADERTIWRTVASGAASRASSTSAPARASTTSRPS